MVIPWPKDDVGTLVIEHPAAEPAAAGRVWWAATVVHPKATTTARAGLVASSAGAASASAAHSTVAGMAPIGLVCQDNDRGCAGDRPAGAIVDTTAGSFSRLATGATGRSVAQSARAAGILAPGEGITACPADAGAPPTAGAARAAGRDVELEGVRGRLRQHRAEVE